MMFQHCLFSKTEERDNLKDTKRIQSIPQRETKMKYSNRYTIRSIEMDTEYRVKSYHLISFAQDAVACYLADSGIAAYDLQRVNQSWILSGIYTDFAKELPRWRTTIITDIWVRKAKGVQYLIDFQISSEDKTVIYANGTTSWSVFDEIERKLARRQDITDKMKVHPEEACPGIQLRKILPYAGDENTLSQTVHSYDIDFNGHLNSIRYIAGALEAVAADTREQKTLSMIHIKYIREAILGDNITCSCYRNPEGGDVYHRLYNQDGEDVAEMNSLWV